MKKTTKNINGVYDNGKWVIRDNYEIIAEGWGLIEYVRAKKEVKANSTKKYVEKFLI